MAEDKKNPEHGAGTKSGWFIRNHKFVERNAFLLLVLSFIVVSIGGLVQIVPLFYLDNTIEKVEGCVPIPRWRPGAARSTCGRAATSATAR